MNNTNKNHDQITKLISLWKSQGQTVQLDADSIEALKWSRYATTFAPGPCYFFLFNPFAPCCINNTYVQYLPFLLSDLLLSHYA